MKEKKILLLGGSYQQIVAIETAKSKGYKTILCDYLSDNPGQYYADKYYNASTTDKEKILDIAMKEEIDGIIAYASDPAAPTAAYVAEKMGLATNPYNSVEILSNKDRFRAFLADNGFNVPKNLVIESEAMIDSTLEYITDNEFELSFPVIVKPVDSSGSKGVSVIYNKDNNTLKNKVKNAIEFALSYSRCKKCIIEEFIEKKHEFLVGGDIFVDDGKIVVWGLLNCHRDESVNNLVPAGKSFPLLLSETDTNIVKDTLQTLVNKLGIISGAFNIEVIIDKDNKAYILDAGARSGGNMIPDLLGEIFDIDMVSMSIDVAMGQNISVIPSSRGMCYASHNIHSESDGFFEDITFSDELESHIIKKVIYKNRGDRISYFSESTKALGIIFIQYDNQSEMMDMLANIKKNIIVKKSEL